MSRFGVQWVNTENQNVFEILDFFHERRIQNPQFIDEHWVEQCQRQLIAKI